MGKTNRPSGNTKKDAAMDRKAKHQAEVEQDQRSKAEADEAVQWSVGAKTGKSKKEQAEDKKAAAAAAKAARDAQLAAEEETARTSNVPKTPKSGKNSTPKKTEPSRGLDLSQLDTETPPADKKVLALNATGIDNAIDALSLTTTSASADQVDKHPERRRKAAYAAFEARRLKEIEEENPGLRRQQRIELCRKEFEKSPENPFNQSNARYDASKEELREIKEKERDRKEGLLVEK